MRIEKYTIPLTYSTPLTVSMDVQAVPKFVNYEGLAGSGVVAIYCENSSLIPQYEDRKFRIEHTNNEIPLDYSPSYIGSDNLNLHTFFHVFKIT